MFNGHPIEDIRDPKYLWGADASSTVAKVTDNYIIQYAKPGTRATLRSESKLQNSLATCWA